MSETKTEIEKDEILPGMLIWHEQAGIGNVLERRDATLTVAFLFLWPIAEVCESAVQKLVATESLKDSVNMLAGAIVKSGVNTRGGE
jgi:hypothetical protein